MGDGILMSERALRLFEKEAMGGIAFSHPVRIVRALRLRRYREPIGEIPPYFYVRLSRTGAAIDYEASGLVSTGGPSGCPECHSFRGVMQKLDRLEILPGTWTGEDFFRIRGFTGDQCITDRAHAVFKANNITGVKWIRNTEVMYRATSYKPNT